MYFFARGLIFGAHHTAPDAVPVPAPRAAVEVEHVLTPLFMALAANRIIAPRAPGVILNNPDWGHTLHV